MVVHRILKALGTKTELNPKFDDPISVSKAVSGLGADVQADFIRLFVEAAKRDKYYRGRWEYPSGWNCVKKKGMQKFPDDFVPLPKERRFGLVFMYGYIIEAYIKALAIASGVKLIDEQARVHTVCGPGHIDFGVILQEEGADDYEKRLIDKGYKRIINEVKSMTGYGFDRFLREDEMDDVFGYKTQGNTCLDATLHSKWHDPEYLPPEGHPPLINFICLNKENGAIADRTYQLDPALVKKRAAEYTLVDGCKTAAEVEAIPRPFTPKTMWSRAKAPKFLGNKLDVPCSYCDFKYFCWTRLRAEAGPKGGVAYWLDDDRTIHQQPKGGAK